MTFPFHMVQLTLDPRAALSFGHARGLVPRGSDYGYLFHAIMRGAFGLAAPQPFREHEASRGGTAFAGRGFVLLGYCRHDGAELCERLRTFALPELHAILDPDRAGAIMSKAMPDHFRQGQRLGFEVRLCPVLRQDRDEKRGRSREIDAFIAATRSCDASEPVLREIVYREWLARELGRDGAAEMTAAAMAGFRRVRIARRNRDRTPTFVEKPDALFRGELLIRDPGAFRALLGRGVGRHRAFGFGMILLRPAE